MKMPSQERSGWKSVGGTDHFKVTGSVKVLGRPDEGKFEKPAYARPANLSV